MEQFKAYVPVCIFLLVFAVMLSAWQQWKSFEPGQHGYLNSNLVLGLSDAALADYWKADRLGDEFGRMELLNSGKVFRVEYNTEVLVLDWGLEDLVKTSISLAGTLRQRQKVIRREVRVLSGPNRGIKVWLNQAYLSQMDLNEA